MLTQASTKSPPIHKKAASFTPEFFKITHHRWETDDVFTLRLDVSAHGGPFSFQPGQFNMLYAMGVGEVAISISGDPANGAELTHTIRALGPVTQAIGKLKKGDVLGVRGPYGTPWPVDAAKGRDVVIVAGGLGTAPLRPALYHILNHREAYGHVTLLIGSRTPKDILFTAELHKWLKRNDIRIGITVDRADDTWKGPVGVVSALIARADIGHGAALPPIAMVCGPEIMMRFTVRELIKQGLSDENIFLSMERNMKCAMGICGRCQLGPEFICKDGPVFSYDKIQSLFAVREL